MISDHIGATTTYMMWREGHIWNVSELQRVHLSIIIIIIIITITIQDSCITPSYILGFITLSLHDVHKRKAERTD
jgi:hypothetical protein